MLPPRNEKEMALDKFVDSNGYDKLQSFLHKAVCEAFAAGWEAGHESCKMFFILPPQAQQEGESQNPSNDEYASKTKRERDCQSN